MQGINISQQCKVVPLLFPISGVTNSDIVNMEGYAHASIIFLQGGAVSAMTVTVKGSDDVSSSNTSAIGFRYYLEATTGGDTLAGGVATGTTGFTFASTNNTWFVIEVDGDELPSGKPFLMVDVGSGALNNGSVVAVLSGPRYAKDQSPTALA